MGKDIFFGKNNNEYIGNYTKGFSMEKNYINGVKINIIKEIILMELKKEKLTFLM